MEDQTPPFSLPSYTDDLDSKALQQLGQDVFPLRSEADENGVDVEAGGDGDRLLPHQFRLPLVAAYDKGEILPPRFISGLSVDLATAFDQIGQQMGDANPAQLQCLLMHAQPPATGGNSAN